MSYFEIIDLNHLYFISFKDCCKLWMESASGILVFQLVTAGSHRVREFWTS